MRVERKLSEWVAAGVIDAPTRDRIAAFERSRARPVVLYALAGLGATAVVVGLVSIVAANWAELGRFEKLAIDLALGGALAAGLWLLEERGPSLLREALVLIDAGYLLASIALVGQLYQLNSPLFHGLLAWSAGTVPVFLLAREPFAARVWFLGLAATWVATWAGLVEQFPEALAGTELLVMLLTPWPFLLLGMALSRWPRRERAGQEFVRCTIAISVLLVLLSQGLWYQTPQHEARRVTLTLLALIVVAAGAAHVYRALREAPFHGRVGSSAAVLASGLSIVAADMLRHGELPLLGALLSILHAALFAWAALGFGRSRWFHLATSYVALRIFIIYVEVFGSMLETGVGLVLTGLAAILVAWLWHKQSRALARRWLGSSP